MTEEQINTTRAAIEKIRRQGKTDFTIDDLKVLSEELAPMQAGTITNFLNELWRRGFDISPAALVGGLWMFGGLKYPKPKDADGKRTGVIKL